MAKKDNYYKRLLLIAFIGVGILTVVISAGVGAASIPPLEVAKTIGSSIPFIKNFIASEEISQSVRTIILQVRLPRILLSLLVGAGLALSGLIFQALLNNALADPYIIGVSSGASLGAVLAIAFRLNQIIPGVYALPVTAFMSAILTITIVYNLAKEKGRLNPDSLLLSGLAVSFSVTALVSIVIIFSRKGFLQMIFWLMGSFSQANWDIMPVISLFIFSGSIMTLFYWTELNALLLGEEQATHLGVDVESIRKRLLYIASFLVASCVSVSGIIAFVGLMIPHIGRFIFGANHRWLIPGSFLFGAVFMSITDTLARTIVHPLDLPVGIITSILGGPFFIFLLKRRKAVL